MPSYHLCRPVLLQFITAGQWCMWYRVPRPGREEEAIHHGLLIPVVTPQDSPTPPGQSSLPLVLHLQDGRVVRRRKHPVAVHWGPQSDYADLAMLRVSSNLKNCNMSVTP